MFPGELPTPAPPPPVFRIDTRRSGGETGVGKGETRAGEGETRAGEGETRAGERITGPQDRDHTPLEVNNDRGST